MKEIIITDEMQRVIDLVENTNQHVFLTGKAGTGKTTLLKHIIENTQKNFIITAPTGVAAINAGGVTLHSMFRLPFTPYKPTFVRGRTLHRLKEYRCSKIQKEVIDNLELLIIDEISMVRADLLDAVNDALCYYRGSFEPFGGVQLLMIGDLHQLPPVIVDSEWSLIEKYYDAPYFLYSKALQTQRFETIELSKIFRQSDIEFMDILNQVRVGQLNADAKNKLDERYDPHFNASNGESYITLCSTNKAAREINTTKLSEIKEKEYQFKFKKTGEFQESAMPCEQILTLKVGAQVMFIANDSGENRRFYNGLIGTVTGIDHSDALGYFVTVSAEINGFKTTIIVTPYEWKNIEYSAGDEGDINGNVIGTCTQLPLKLAWAITIHKSQGLTFDNVIVDAGYSFAHGQVYVALSRCRSLEGLHLISKISQRSIVFDGRVQIKIK